jgi:hypothetical protein
MFIDVLVNLSDTNFPSITILIYVICAFISLTIYSRTALFIAFLKSALSDVSSSVELWNFAII